MPIIRGNARHNPPIVSVSILPALPLAGLPGSAATGSNAFGLTCRALLDTGADGTSINRKIAEAAGLESRGKQLVTGIGGQNYHRSWITFLGFHTDSRSPGFPFILDDALIAIELPEYHAFEVIIGRDVLMMGDFTLKSNGDFMLSLPG